MKDRPPHNASMVHHAPLWEGRGRNPGKGKKDIMSDIHIEKLKTAADPHLKLPWKRATEPGVAKPATRPSARREGDWIVEGNKWTRVKRHPGR